MFSRLVSFLQNLLNLPQTPPNSINETTSRILCIDDDPDFCLYVERLAASLEISFDKAFTIVQAKHKIEEGIDYNLFIIDGHLPDGSGFELAAWIRERKKLNTPIIFLSRVYHDAVSFRILKESLGVDFVLEKPIRPNELRKLLSRICTKKIFEDTFPESLLADAKADYQKTIVDKIEHLEKMIVNAQNRPTIDNLKLLKLEIHKLAGSAGSYGYSEVSDLCKNLETDLIKQIELTKHSMQDSDWLKSLDQFFAKLKSAYQIFKEPDFTHNSLGPPIGSIYTFYIVENNPEQICFWNAFLNERSNYLVEPANQPAFRKLVAPDFIARVVLVNLNPEDTIDRYKNVLKFQRMHRGLTVFGLSIEIKNSNAILQAIHEQVPYILTFPPSTRAAGFMLDQSDRLAGKYKIMVVDDDEDNTRYIEQSLSLLGFEVKILNDSLLLQEALMNENPDVLIADIDLSDPKKGDILPLLNKIDFKNLFIGMVTITLESNLIKKIYGTCVDDILFKPLDTVILQKRVLSLLQTSSKSRKTSNSQCVSEKLKQPKEVWLIESDYSGMEKIRSLFEELNFEILIQSIQSCVEKCSIEKNRIFIISGSDVNSQTSTLIAKFNDEFRSNIPVLYLSDIDIVDLRNLFKEELMNVSNLIVIIDCHF